MQYEGLTISDHRLLVIPYRCTRFMRPVHQVQLYVPPNFFDPRPRPVRRDCGLHHGRRAAARCDKGRHPRGAVLRRRRGPPRNRVERPQADTLKVVS